MRFLFAAFALSVSTAQAAPLTLYDTSREQTQIAPIAPASPCGDFAVACSAAPGQVNAPLPPRVALPFDYGMSVSGTFIGSNHRSYAGYGVSGWIAAKDVPLTIQFDYQQLQPLGGRR